MWAAISYIVLAVVFIVMGWQVDAVYFSIMFFHHRNGKVFKLMENIFLSFFDKN